jgi:hypothetical protein
MVREERVHGVLAVIEARAVGALGWTWSYFPESGAAGSNNGRLLPSESASFEAALTGAQA